MTNGQLLIGNENQNTYVSLIIDNCPLTIEH